MQAKQTIKKIDVKGKKVLVRVDFNVPLKDGSITDDTRIRAALPTIRYLVDHGARVIITSHMGRPDGTNNAELSLKPARRSLERLIGRNVAFAPGTIDDAAFEAVDRMLDGEILMLENIRFHEGEKKNDTDFAARLASMADIFVNDAFGAVHRAHASTAGVAEFIPSYAGLLLDRELKTLSNLLTDPERPFIAILGGSKVSDKFGVVDKLIEIVDVLLIGGGMAFTFLKAKGIDIGSSIFEEEWIEAAGKMLKKAEEQGCELILPVDFIAADAFAEDANTRVVGREEIPADMMGLDIGPASCELFKAEISQAKTIFWNGPMGVFEMQAFQTGTKEVAEAVARNSRSVSVIGGGDSAAALKKFGLEDRVSFVSTGGGASMKFLEGASLPGVEALKDAE